MKILLAIILLSLTIPMYAAQRLPTSHRTSLAEAPVEEASNVPAPVWKLSLLSLAALGFVIRKRL